MKFVIEHVSKTSGRLGHLVHTETGKQFKTPLLLQTTKGGSIPYLSREVFEYITKEVQILQMSLATMDQMAGSLSTFKGGLSAFCGFKDYPNMLIIHDPGQPMRHGFHEQNMVPMFTRRGKVPLTPEGFMNTMECFVPDIYQGLCDADTNSESPSKRKEKSVQRTTNFMDYCYERHRKSEKLKNSALFAPIVGGYCTHARSKSISHCLTHGKDICAGYLLEGFHSYGLSATEVDAAKLIEIVAHCIKELEVDKPKMLPGAYTPLTMLEMIALGVDMFDTSYAYLAAINFKALTFNYDLSSNRTEGDNTTIPFLDVTDEGLKQNTSPLLADCECLACRKHMRAYVHHLYKTNELLGPILLMIHNLHHHMKFFEAIHSCISDDKLSELKELIKYQRTTKEIDYRIYANTKVVGKASFGHGGEKINSKSGQV